MNVRRLAPLAVCASLILAGCGGGGDDDEAVTDPSETPSSSPSASGSPSASASPSASGSASPTARATASSKPDALSLSFAKRLAAAGILLSSDMSGFTRATQAHDETDTLTERVTKDCLDLALTAYQTRNFGYTYRDDGVDVSTNTEVVATREQARSELNALRSSDGPRCFRDALLEVAPEGVDLDVKLIPVIIAGADKAVAYRISFTLEGEDVDDDVHGSGYNVVALVGQTEIWLDTSEGRKTPKFSLAKLTALAEKLVRRVKAVDD